MRIFFALALITLTACTTQKVSLKNDKEVLAEQSRTYLLLGVDTAHQLDSIVLDGPGLKTITFTKNDLHKGSNYILVTIPEGDYSISKVHVLSNYYFNLEENMWKFSAKPNSVNYAGTLKVRGKNWLLNGAYFELMNESSIALDFLEASFPNLMKSRKMNYAGPGQDSYFETLEKSSETKK